MQLATLACCVIAAAAVLGATVIEARRCPVLHATGDAEKSGCYIVVLRQVTSASEFQSVLHRVVQMADGAKVYGSVTRVAKAFTVKLSAYALHAVSTNAPFNLYVHNIVMLELKLLTIIVYYS